MRRKKDFLMLGVLCIVVASACSKGELAADPHQTDFSDTTTPVVQINTPSDNQAFKSGAIIHITGRVTDNGLYQGTIRIMEDATNIILKDQSYQIHGYQVYDFSLDYQPIVTSPSTYTIKVNYEDHGLNIGGQQVKVTVTP